MRKLVQGTATLACPAIPYCFDCIFPLSLGRVKQNLRPSLAHSLHVLRLARSLLLHAPCPLAIPMPPMDLPRWHNRCIRLQLTCHIPPFELKTLAQDLQGEGGSVPQERGEGSVMVPLFTFATLK